MNSQNNWQLRREQFMQFLEEKSTEYNFHGDWRQVFMARFDPDNLDTNNKNLRGKIKWNTEPIDCPDLKKNTEKSLDTRFETNLKSIIKKLEEKGCFIKYKEGRGAYKKGEAPWLQANKWLWEKFDQWQAEQDHNIVSEPNNPLPEDFRIYVNDESRSIIRYDRPGHEEKVLPTINRYYKEGKLGGYIGCYSHNPEKGVCCVDDGIYLIGQIWMEGEYKGRIFVPKNYEGTDISTDAQLKQMCNVVFPPEGGEDCWPGGDTGGWFGYY
ncbi:MAG: hypothetical protein ACRC1Z_10690 [Waterburya sp.]